MFDFYHGEFGTLVDNPGILYVNLLLMGDRQGEFGYRVSGFDGLWGAGRLQARQWDDTGMDAPWQWATGWVCVDDGTYVPLTINSGSAISSDVDYFKAAIWWYDPTGDVEDVDLALLKDTTGTGTWANVRTSATADNKEFVYATSSSFAGLKLQLRMIGTDVITTHDTGCGSNSMKVFYAYFFEDGDRDDSDGPAAADIDPEDEH